ncbi:MULTISPECIES: Hpt domain-containing protein [Pseudovibrio]|uniref:Hpt domain-containing protein n=1 Tax=Stappiaceae TaxID=2821832 RepID=UPI0023662914|nr:MULTISPECIES: Hpt domain-containing protein [Pseudovibrio]MDD7910554.1 Hpt domain-containing protein [Pseudovibrio exalbescens]MDX5594597.1 Hpt domain-containing protein [Pseudovibrio sp. SPO723]
MIDKNSPAEKDAEVFRAPLDLSKKVRKLTAAEAAQFDPVKAAEDAVAELSEEFSSWMDNEARDLRSAWATVTNGNRSKEAYEELFRTAHDIKGQAETLGFPLVGEVAGSLTELISAMQSGEIQVPEELITQHIAAIAAMLREDARDASNITARILVESLAQATAKILGRDHNADTPDDFNT